VSTEPSQAPITAAPTPAPTPAPTTAASDPQGSSGKKESETTEIAIIAAVTALLIGMIITGFVLLAKSKKVGDSRDSRRENYANPLYGDVVVNNTSEGFGSIGPAPQYESSAPALDNEADC